MTLMATHNKTERIRDFMSQKEVYPFTLQFLKLQCLKKNYRKKF